MVSGGAAAPLAPPGYATDAQPQRPTKPIHVNNTWKERLHDQTVESFDWTNNVE